MFKILRPKWIGPLDKPISIPPPVTSKLGAIDLILQMLNDTGFCPNAFDGDKLMGCSLEQLKNAVSEFVEVMILLVGKNTTPRDKIAIPSGSPQEHPSGSPHHASAGSEIESDGSISVRRMPLGPLRRSFLKDRIGKARIESFEKQSKIDIKPRSSVISRLKEFSGKGRDEDWAWSWIGKVRSAFDREQIPDEEKCLEFGDLLTVPAEYWYLQLKVSI